MVCPICKNSPIETSILLNGYEIFCCTSCELYFAPSAFNVNLDYDDVWDSSEYEKNQIQSLNKSIKFANYSLHPTYFPFFKKLKHVKGMRLLDIGCGVGRFCLAAYAKGWNVTGIDISEKAIEIACSFNQFAAYKSSVVEMLDRKEKYNVITAFEVLEHLKNPLEFMNGIQQLLLPNGHLFCTVPNWDCGEVRNTIEKDMLPPIHLTFYTKKALRKLGQFSGFNNMEIGKIWTDYFPDGSVPRIKWLMRRLLKKNNLPLGLWLHASI